jgi:hypothetical protein
VLIAVMLEGAFALSKKYEMWKALLSGMGKK